MPRAPQQLRLPFEQPIVWQQMPLKRQQACRQLLALLLRQTVVAEAKRRRGDE